MGTRRDPGVFTHSERSASSVVPHWVLSSKPHRHAPANIQSREKDDYVGPRRSSLASPCPPGPFDIISMPPPHRINTLVTHTCKLAMMVMTSMWVQERFAHENPSRIKV